MALAGFQRVVTEVSLDLVGMILGVEVSWLTRWNRDWHQLLELCALFRTLIADTDGVYDPAQYNDRLQLGLKGTMSEAELHILNQRMRQGALSKARCGELKFALPVGYVWDAAGQIQLDLDEQVQQVARLIFRTFDELGTVNAVVRYLAQHQIELGVRVQEGPGKGELGLRTPVVRRASRSYDLSTEMKTNHQPRTFVVKMARKRGPAHESPAPEPVYSGS